MEKKIKLAIVGATGLVGRHFLKVLEEKPNIQIESLSLYASFRSAGTKVKFRDKEYVVEELKIENIINKFFDYALFSAGGEVSKKFAPIFAEIGTVVIDNSSYFRNDGDVPLVVPQVNIKDAFANRGIISNPNCSTIQCVAPLFVLNKLYDLKRVDYTTYQAVSGSGIKGIKDLNLSINGEKCEFYPYPIFGNVLPHIDSFLDNGFTKEEIKMVNETKKILHSNNLEVSATCVRVPVKNAHSISIIAECKNEVNENEFRNILNNFDGIKVLDSPKENIYPIASIANGTDYVYVGRIRKDLFNKNKIHFFTVADNLRKGAASNAIEILEKMIEQF